MLSEALQHNINRVPIHKQKWIGTTLPHYSEEQSQVLLLSVKKWKENFADKASDNLTDFYSQLSAQTIWSNAFVETFKQKGWYVVPVKGIIPQRLFFELLAERFLPIAYNIRTLDYFPDPYFVDFIHDIFQFSNILTDEAFSNFLYRLGQIGSKVIYTNDDVKLNRFLKQYNKAKYENPASSDVVKIEAMRLQHFIENFTKKTFSEAAQLVNFYWKTLKLGAFGNLQNPQIAGAALQTDFLSIKEKLSRFEKVIFSEKEFSKPLKYITEEHLYLFPGYEFLTVQLDKFERQLTISKANIEKIKAAVKSDFPVKFLFDNNMEYITNIMYFENYQLSENDKLHLLKGIGDSQVKHNNKELFFSQDGLDILNFASSEHIENIRTYLSEKKDNTFCIKLSDTHKIDAEIESTYTNEKGTIIAVKLTHCYLYLDEKIIYYKQFILSLHHEIKEVSPTYVARNQVLKNKHINFQQQSEAYKYFNLLSNDNSQILPKDFLWLATLLGYSA